MKNCFRLNEHGFFLFVTMLMLIVFSAVTIHALAVFDREKGFIIMEIQHTYAEHYFDNGLDAVKKAIQNDESTNFTLMYDQGEVNIMTEMSDEDYDVIIAAQYQTYERDRRYLFDQNGELIRRIR
ncbi:hypothetical protein [Salisediminibacterium halotolerans]|uniref:hypothetical protein n=1 Tax=Salisediminibacterium halotolerans TaxID=517425 RepID=UPI000EB28A25|nr:hypothetical protein [Salisediminibacterium halotolerans]RLJ78092.1 ComG operon protein 7 [Actinophytocola xinjiangensis]RPE88570.1 hypothetical protein EDD67_0901 [Salisediminibacterium halotolerans]TWG37069.1 ComG operon protein 7 [Salisediminibacterium halotolerans]GEL06924.1 hypothetical protein SHA02_03400 [Salisediminibacterium halotolerans]